MKIVGCNIKQKEDNKCKCILSIVVSKYSVSTKIGLAERKQNCRGKKKETIHIEVFKKVAFGMKKSKHFTNLQVLITTTEINLSQLINHRCHPLRSLVLSH